MEYSVDASDGVAAEIGVAHIAGDDLEILARSHLFEPSPIVEGIILRQGAHLPARGQKSLGQMRADKTVGAGDQSFHRMW